MIVVLTEPRRDGRLGVKMKNRGKWGVCILLGASALLLGSCKDNRREPMAVEEKESLKEAVREEERDWVVFAESLEGENEEKAHEMAVQSIVRLETENNGKVYFGSGILWDADEERIVIATSGHLLEEGRLLRVVFPGGKEAPGEAAGSCEQKDMAFVTVPVSRLEEAGQEVRVVSLHQRIFDTLDYSSRLLALGCSESGVGDQFRGGTLKEKAWYREEFGADVMVLECESQPGMSGGGIFDCYGNLVGMLEGGSGNFTAAFSMETINEGYEEVFGVKRDTQDYK